VNRTQQQPDRPAPHDEGSGGSDGGIVIGWITKLALTAAVIGTLGFDGISVGLGHLSTTDDANTAVQAASQNYQSSHNLTQAYDAALAAIKPQESIATTDFVIKADGTASLTLTNTVHTLVLFRTSQTKKWPVITVRATGKYTGS
jgi:hypothetical protein